MFRLARGRWNVILPMGGYAEAEEVGSAVEDTRAAIARLIGAESPERIVFTFNGTDSLNLAIHGTLRHGDHVCHNRRRTQLSSAAIATT